MGPEIKGDSVAGMTAAQIIAQVRYGGECATKCGVDMMAMFS
ncbi:hypothetical protein SAMN05421595_1372 [Austwickia chelonae]|nr:hypothetical protein SAMN05421595_1372 [Austwickia chelonae]